MRTDWVLIGLLYAVGLLAAAQFAKVALTLEALAGVYPGSPVEIAVSALSLMGILFGVTSGVIIARIGPRKVILGALVAAALASGVQALLPGFDLFMALRVAEGAAHLALVVAAPTLMATVAQPRHIPFAMGLWGTFFGVGFALSAAVLPALGAPPVVFLAHGAALLVLAVALWPRLQKGTGGQPLAEGILARHLAIYSSLRLTAPGLIFFWHTVVFMGLLTYLPGFLGAWTAPLLPLAALLGTLGAGAVTRWLQPFHVGMFGLAGTFLGMALLLFLPEIARPLAALPIFVVTGMLAGASFATVPWLHAEQADRARANGAIAQLGNVGTALSVPLMAATLWAGISGPLVFAMVVSAIGLGATWLIHRKIASDG